MNNNPAEVSRLEQANVLGLAYVRTMVFLNGGAILALLTYLGNSSAQLAVTIPLETIKCSMVAFIFGIAALMFALLVSYSYTANAPEETYSRFWNNWIITFNCVVCLLSLGAFTYGVLSLVWGASQTA